MANETPAYIAENIDAIRDIGNFPARPIKDENTVGMSKTVVVTGCEVEYADSRQVWPSRSPKKRPPENVRGLKAKGP